MSPQMTPQPTPVQGQGHTSANFSASLELTLRDMRSSYISYTENKLFITPMNKMMYRRIFIFVVSCRIHTTARKRTNPIQRPRSVQFLATKRTTIRVTTKHPAAILAVRSLVDASTKTIPQNAEPRYPAGKMNQYTPPRVCVVPPSSA